MEPNDLFERPILSNPYLQPVRYWELDGTGQATQEVIETRRRAEFVTPIPRPRKRKGAAAEGSLLLDEGNGLSTAERRYELTSSKINDLRGYVKAWRKLPNPQDWLVTPETARLLQHWRTDKFNGLRPFFCQIEAAETAIWLSEVAPKFGKGVINHLGENK
jgi:type III restriction enzyme